VRVSRVGLITALSGVIMLGAAIVLPGAVSGTQQASPAPAEIGEGHGSALEAGIRAAQNRLTDVPGDWVTWAQLGSAYVQQARVSADPSYYPRAEGALRRSLDIRPEANWQALVGLAALANARHDFTTAVDLGRRAAAINSYGGSVHGVLADALTQLGDYTGARDEIQAMLDVQPGVASFARASYHWELHGDNDRARHALEAALADASDRSDVAFCRFYLGELAFNSGDADEALTQYLAAHDADPRYRLAQAGLAKAYAALGRTDDALREYEAATAALPVPSIVAEYGDLLTLLGRTPEAQRQYDLVKAQHTLLAANAATDRISEALFLADHGQASDAVAAAQAEWSARRNVEVADALAWALHQAGRDAEALPIADEAAALGWRNAAFAYHRATIRYALGDLAGARSDVAQAISINPQFSMRHAPDAAGLLAQLGGPP
jgi:tetratricopeptide (TPR) repeat protein